MFLSLIIQKLELINLFFRNEKIKIMIICEYILSLLINFFFNTLLYSDEVVSSKYHSNGKLDFIVTLTLSILSNIITSIIDYYSNYSEGIEERLDLIMELKNKEYYLKNMEIFMKYLKIKFFFFFLIELLIVFGSFYYIVIFCIVYSYSRKSLFINYLMSLLESFITSVAITILILVTRLIGLKCLNNKSYNVSKYINNKF